MVLGKDNGSDTSPGQASSREHSALSLLITVCGAGIAAVVTAVLIRRIDRAEAAILDAIDEVRAQQLAGTAAGSGRTG